MRWRGRSPEDDQGGRDPSFASGLERIYEVVGFVSVGQAVADGKNRQGRAEKGGFGPGTAQRGSRKPPAFLLYYVRNAPSTDVCTVSVAIARRYGDG